MQGEQKARISSFQPVISKLEAFVSDSTDLAYVVGTNAAQATVAGETISFELPVTHIFRREAGVWKSIHQHADVVPALQAASGQTSS